MDLEKHVIQSNQDMHVCGYMVVGVYCHTPIKGQYRVHTSYVRPRNSRTHKLTN
jgi:hypothetical protein